jgi:ABC-type branched-subunit amino acid transport system substrate-binding protein
MAYRVGAEDFTLQLERIREADVEAVVHWGDAVDGARILNQMRALGMQQPYIACDRCVSQEFLDLAGANAEGVLCAYPWNPQADDPDLAAFRAAYRAAYGLEPDTYSAHAYDGMNVLIGAIEAAGLNRAKIRDVIAHGPGPFKGVTGEIRFSATLDDLGEVFLARVENGRFVFHSREQLEIPGGTIAPRDRVNRKGAAGH